MIVWAIANLKGGVGKTTTTITLAGLLASRGYRTLMLDMDPQGSLTSYFGLNPDTTEQSIYQLYQEKGYQKEFLCAQLLHTTSFNRLWFLPASTAMATLDKQLGAQSGKGLVIDCALKTLHDQFDYVLIDCSPGLGILMVNALAACQYLVIPVQTEYLALKGLDRMLNALVMVSRARKKKLEYVIVPTMYDQRTRASNDVLKKLNSEYAEHTWDCYIPIDTQFREASREGIPLSLKSANHKGALAYSLLLDTLLMDTLSVKEEAVQNEVMCV